MSSLWLGTSLATLFLYPLVSAIADQIFYLQWRPANNLELLLAFTVLALTLGALLLATESIKNAYLRLVATLAICFVPLASFGIHVLRQLGFKSVLMDTADLVLRHRQVVLPVVMLGSAGLAVLFLRYRRGVRVAVLKVVLIMSPLSIFSVAAVLRSGMSFTPIEIQDSANARPAPPSAVGLPNVFVLVFDELDYEYLYSGSEVRADFPHIRAFAAGAENYHEARAPGGATLTSMIGLIAGRPLLGVDDTRGRSLYEVLPDGRRRPLGLSSDGVFSEARRRGYRTALYGWLHPYCMMLEGALDSCRTFSVYNYSAVEEPVSILNPIYTNIILWPNQLPFGILKRPIYSLYQHRVVTRTYELTIAALDSREPLFCLFHYSIPHLPFVYDGVHYRPAADPFLQNSENYIRQLRHVDYVFGRFVDELGSRGMLERSHVLLSSDHGYRIMRSVEEWNHVPLILRRAGRAGRRDIHEPVGTETVLSDLLRPDRQGMIDGAATEGN